MVEKTVQSKVLPPQKCPQKSSIDLDLAQQPTAADVGLPNPGWPIKERINRQIFAAASNRSGRKPGRNKQQAGDFSTASHWTPESQSCGNGEKEWKYGMGGKGQRVGFFQSLFQPPEEADEMKRIRQLASGGGNGNMLRKSEANV
jgi:hypothetical protein